MPHSENFRILLNFAADPINVFKPGNRLKVVYDSPKYDALSMYEDDINAIWDEKRAVSNIFNGAKFRLDSVTPGEQSDDNDSSASSKFSTMYIGLSDYKHQIGTTGSRTFYDLYFLEHAEKPWVKGRYPPHVAELEWQRTRSESNGEDANWMQTFDFDKGKVSVSSNTFNGLHPNNDDEWRKVCCVGIGNGTIVESSDGFICFLRRSPKLTEKPGYTALPGGHAEPSHLPAWKKWKAKNASSCKLRELSPRSQARTAFEEYCNMTADGGGPQASGPEGGGALLEKQILEECLQFNACETEEELGIPIDVMKEAGLYLIGLTEREPIMRTCLAAYTRLDGEASAGGEAPNSCWSRKRIENAWLSAKDRTESSGLHWEPRSSFETPEAIRDFCDRERIPGDHLGVLVLLYRMYKSQKQK